MTMGSDLPNSRRTRIASITPEAMAWSMINEPLGASAPRMPHINATKAKRENLKTLVPYSSANSCSSTTWYGVFSPCKNCARLKALCMVTLRSMRSICSSLKRVLHGTSSDMRPKSFCTTASCERWSAGMAFKNEGSLHKPRITRKTSIACASDSSKSAHFTNSCKSAQRSVCMRRALGCGAVKRARSFRSNQIKLHMDEQARSRSACCPSFA
mmetsp:Transcript_1281/g.3872  ORF Transcript_1281/g.3872 Transcript_1281/m.3872 type:complete len:213 (-) Transcript_1281:418-1056(-)